MKDILKTPTHRIQIHDSASVQVSKPVGIGALGELLPSAVRAEIKAMSVDMGQSQAKREAAAKIINRLHSGERINVLGSGVVTLLADLVIHTALTQPESDAVLAALKA